MVTRFLHKLFGSDDSDTVESDHSTTYREAFRRGAHAVTVDAGTEVDVERVSSEATVGTSASVGATTPSTLATSKPYGSV